VKNFLSHRPVAAALLVVLLGVAAHLPALSGGFLWDDNLWLQDSPVTIAADGWQKAWTGAAWDWYPVTSLAFWAEWRLFGADPVGYHAVQLGLHLFGAVLLLFLLRRLRVPGAEIVAMLFAVHPVTVGTVAWIAEQKNTLAFVFSVAAALAWMRGLDEERPRLAVVWILGVLALLSKATAVALPGVLLLLAVWRRPGRFGRDVLRLAPLLAGAAVVAVVTIRFQSQRVFGTEAAGDVSIPERLAGAGRAVVHYAVHALAPARASIIEARWDPATLSPLWWLGLLVPLAFVLVGFRRGAAGKGAAVGVAIWIVGLLPVLGFVDMYYTRYSFVADHWHYFALPALLAVVVAAFARAPSALTIPLGMVVLAAATFLSNAQARRYESALTFWETVHERNREAWVALNGLGTWYAREGDPGAAMSYFEEAVAVRDDYALAWDNLGRTREVQGDAEGAREAFARAVQISPEFDVARSNYGRTLALAGRFPEAIEELQIVVERRPEATEPRANLAMALAQAGRVHESIDQYEQLLERDPHIVTAHETVARLYARRGELDLAHQHMLTVLELQPDHPQAPAVVRALEKELGLPSSLEEPPGDEAP
jgi:tetratricopeptide (TPR) repeat protein